LWTTDGQRVVFTSDREGDHGLFWQRVDGGPAERLAKLEQGLGANPDTWSPDGKVLIFTNRTTTGLLGGNAGNAGISALSIGTGKKTEVVIKQHATNPSLSPDGRWLAYVGTESRPVRVYVEPFPPTGEKHQITDNGGNPLWSPDGKQLFFMRGGRQILS